jgi:hypothetical protein
MALRDVLLVQKFFERHIASRRLGGGAPSQFLDISAKISLLETVSCFPLKMADQDQEMQDAPTEGQEFELDGSDYNIRVVIHCITCASGLTLKPI